MRSGGRRRYLPGMEPLLVVYDADCGVCQASVEWLRKRDRRGRLRFVGNDGEIPAGISREETEHTVVVIEGARKLTRGAAMARLLRELRGWALLGHALRLPGSARPTPDHLAPRRRRRRILAEPKRSATLAA